MSILIHTVWSTKNRFPFLNSPELRAKVWEHIKENAAIKKICIDTINGYSDHCHCLINLASGQKLSRVMMLIKGESAYWINKSRLCPSSFGWQDHYYSFRVPQSAIETVRRYIRNQEEHHKNSSFGMEGESFESNYKKQG